MNKSLVEMAAAIIQAQSSSKAMTTDEVTFALQATFKALQDLRVDEDKYAADGVVAERSDVAPDISPAKSIQKNKVICLECGQGFRMLSPKHLKSHDLTGREYRVKYGFSLRQPLCAKSLSERRKKAGKARGLPDNLRKAIANRKKTGSKKISKKK